MVQPPPSEKCVQAAVEALLPLLQPSAAAAPAGAARSGAASLLFAAAAPRTEGLAPTPIEVDVTFLRAVPPHRVPLYFTLPHAFHGDDICVVTPAPQRKYKDALAACRPDLRRRVTRVIDVRKLATKYSDAVSTRVWTKAYRTFFIHGAVTSFPPQMTGEFVERRGHPVWMPRRPSFEASLDAALCTAVCPRRGFNVSSVVVGTSDMPASHVVENVVSFVGQLTAHPQGAPLRDILVVRVAGVRPAAAGRPALAVWAHDFSVDDPSSFDAPPTPPPRVEAADADVSAAASTVAAGLSPDGGVADRAPRRGKGGRFVKKRPRVEAAST